MGTVQDVRIAKRTGFCYGVREAIDKAKESAAAGKSTHTLGQVVHNDGVVRELQDLGIQTVEALDDVDHGAAVVIRAHGVRPDVLARAEARGLEVIDGTCTWVIAEQRELRKLVDEGYTIVLLGTPNHPEVVGLLGFAPDVIVVDEEPEWDAAIPRRKKLALISQSTQPPWKFEKLAAMMVSRSHELKIVNTVCPVTIRRQEDTVELAREVDLMVVVGGRSSANTKELTRLCEIVGTRAVQIQGVADLTDAAVFADARVVGVTGGTSTPIEDLRDVVRWIYANAGHARGRGRRRGPRRCRPRRRRHAGRPDHLPPDTGPRRHVRRRLTRGGQHGRAPGRRHRRAAERRQEHALQPDRRRAHGHRRGPRADDARPPLRRRGVERPAVRDRRHRRPRARPGRPHRGARPGAGAAGDRRGRRHRLRGRRRRPA